MLYGVIKLSITIYLDDLLLHWERIALNVACNREVNIEPKRRLNSITSCNGKLKMVKMVPASGAPLSQQALIDPLTIFEGIYPINVF
jgi:hypothetical protein